MPRAAVSRSSGIWISVRIPRRSFIIGIIRRHCKGERVTVRDLFYGTILPSGADAAVGLACYVSGSHEAFVELMNQKLNELGLSGSTHFFVMDAGLMPVLAFL